MMRITISDILIVLLVSSAVDAQSVWQPAPPRLVSLHKNDPSFAPVVLVLGLAFLFVGFFTIYLRHCSDGIINVSDPPVAAVSYPSHEPQGIDPKLLDTFPILVYSTLKDLKLGSVALECAVCLSEFKPHDLLRLIPKCNHVFHPDCINTWLASQVTCPVCRAMLKPPEHHSDEDEVAVVIHNEVNVQEEVRDRSAARRTDVGSGERGLRRCHSTGHSLGLDEWRGKAMERYTLRLTEEVRKQIVVNHGEIQRSSSTNFDVFPGRPGEGSSRGRCFCSHENSIEFPEG